MIFIFVIVNTIFSQTWNSVY